ncbi:MAG TPA: CDP-alcohol phosphatidyltransferase family protein [Vicinamibacterales bacterium]|nr:CDP-alcohol phosphatidyltransferase family protein [Vicinamibacterales bacterium]
MTSHSSGLAFKAREIEELVDVYFFRRLGIVFALLARALRLTPTMVTVGAMMAGAAGGALLASPRYALLGVALLILHGVLDSSDGQLARLTGQSTEFGRMMDGVAGYVTHIAMYLGILASGFARGYGWELFAAAGAAGACTIVHAQMYDYHRTTYAACVLEGEALPAIAGHPHAGIVGLYEAMQRAIAGRHPAVEQAIAGRAVGGRVRDDDRQRYRACFYRPVRGWNLMGDNVRRLAIAVAAWSGRPEWFIVSELVPVNAAFVVLWWVQRRADARFLEGT